MEKVKVDENIVLEIELADLERKTKTDILLGLLDMHKSDKDSILNTPVYKDLERQIVGTTRKWNELKDEMAKKYLKDGAKEWSLDYSTCELTMIF